MSAVSKRKEQINAKVDRLKVYSVEQAVEAFGALQRLRFRESLDVAIQLGIDPKRSDQAVRGVTDLPSGTGKEVKIAVFAEGEQADLAREAGASAVGTTELAESIKRGELGYDVVIAHTKLIPMVAPLGRILGPRGLMPNPRSGTVVEDVVAAVKRAKAGQFSFRNDRYGIVHGSIGRVGFAPEAVASNLQAVLDALLKAKPSGAKGVYIKKATLSTTMGPGLRVDLNRFKIH